MQLLTAGLLGALIGLALGALGGGGSILTVPALVYLLGEPARAAATGSLVIVGVTSLLGALGHARSGDVRWAAGAVFGLVGVAASFAGTAVNGLVAPNLLLLLFAALLVAAAAAMARRPKQPPAPRPEPETLDPVVAGARATATLVAPAPQPVMRFSAGAAARVAVAGLAVGFLTGFFGVGGGFIAVPALVMALGYAMPVAVGTSLLVIAVNSAAALVARAGSETFHWTVIVPVTVAAVAASVAGTALARRLPAPALRRGFAALLLAVAAYTAARSATALG